MPWLFLYLDKPTMEYLREKASQKNASLSKYVGELLQEQAASNWPDRFFGLYGALGDEGFIEPTELDFSNDAQQPSW